jgi:Na+/proline symporter
MNAISTHFDWNDKYNLWSGVIGGFFLSLSYFGTDQSQVGRYLSGKSEGESRKGLLTTALVKIPMQYLILLIGALLIAFYHFHPSPIFFNEAALKKIESTSKIKAFNLLNISFADLQRKKKEDAYQFLNSSDENTKLSYKIELMKDKIQEKRFRSEAKSLLKQADFSIDTNDTNYIFLNFVLHYFPAGLVGLMIAVIFCASWSSTASELNALSSTSVIDLYQRLFAPSRSENHYMWMSKLFTLFWGLVAIGVAQFANALGSMIEAVNVLGSLFYGTVLGVFVVAFFLKYVKGSAVFWAAIVAELTVIFLYQTNSIAFLWLNMIGCVLVAVLGCLLQWIQNINQVIKK